AIAAAGFHHLLMSGPPGAGKSLIAKCIPGIMPKLSYDESLEVTTIYSVAGKLSEEMPFVIRRPFWSPHHSSSAQAICGGGSMARPGLCSLSHRGILFLDEMTEFKRETIDMLRQPLEDGKITISRAKQTFTYPAKFMLVGALNPCPCGFYPDRNKCRCSQNAIERYLSRLSGPILDRIDICVEVNRLEPKLLNGVRQQGLSSKEIQERVEACVNIQKKRYEKESFKFNSQIPAAKINTYIPLGKEETEFVYEAYEQMNLSMRSFYKILRVARTIADYEGEENVSIAHLAEASCYRFPEYMGG
ncbi:MAG: ATP-binding protein, partial [Lachnospiraceae bacterium]|nr:ATP-binding protein [Lachnospiraceae bacterium]